MIAQVEELAGMAPEFRPLFLNISETAGEELESRGGPFGLVLRLVQQRKLRRSVFEETLVRVVRSLEDRMADEDRERWLGLLSYIDALIYHERERPEHDELKARVLDAIQTDPHRQEVYEMGQSMAEYLKEQGAREEAVRSRQQTLLDQLRIKFKRVPENIVRRVELTDSVEQLTAWLNAIIKAKKLADVGIPPVE
jgi:hypothetical protein